MKYRWNVDLLTTSTPDQQLFHILLFLPNIYRNIYI
jgi:hypothetical protein